MGMVTPEEDLARRHRAAMEMYERESRQLVALAARLPLASLMVFPDGHIETRERPEMARLRAELHDVQAFCFSAHGFTSEAA